LAHLLPVSGRCNEAGDFPEAAAASVEAVPLAAAFGIELYEMPRHEFIDGILYRCALRSKHLYALALDGCDRITTHALAYHGRNAPADEQFHRTALAVVVVGFGITDCFVGLRFLVIEHKTGGASKMVANQCPGTIP
jgi:hypothetical protein